LQIGDVVGGALVDRERPASRNTELTDAIMKRGLPVSMALTALARRPISS